MAQWLVLATKDPGSNPSIINMTFTFVILWLVVKGMCQVLFQIRVITRKVFYVFYLLGTNNETESLKCLTRWHQSVDSPFVILDLSLPSPHDARVSLLLIGRNLRLLLLRGRRVVSDHVRIFETVSLKQLPSSVLLKAKFIRAIYFARQCKRFWNFMYRC